MKKLILAITILFNCSYLVAQDYRIDQYKVQEDLDQILNDLSLNYIYLKEKAVDLNCITEHYKKSLQFNIW